MGASKVLLYSLEVRKPDYFLDAAGKTPSDTVGQVIIKMDEVLEEIKPHALLVLGDTNSCLSVISAKRRKVPVFHMEAGNRCFDERVPEEINRKIIDHIADINMPYSDIAREYLISEGILPDRIIKTGSPMNEVIKHNYDGIISSNIMSKMNLKQEKFFLVSAHREENVVSERQLNKLLNILNHLCKKYKFPVIVSTHPRTRQKIEEAGITLDPLIELSKPLGYKDYVNLQLNSKATLSDSGTITEESSLLNFPALNIREAHERPEGMEEGSVMMIGLETDRLDQCLSILEDQPRTEKDRKLRKVSDYDVPNVSDKVVRIIHSYTDYIQRVVWKSY